MTSLIDEAVAKIRQEKSHGANPECSYRHMSTQRKGRLFDGSCGIRVD